MKARWFNSLGYGEGDWALLMADLLAGVATTPAMASERNEFGRKYLVLVTLRVPGRSGIVTTVWVVLDGEEFPRFVTAYPA